MIVISKIIFKKFFKCYLEKDIDIEYCDEIKKIVKELMGFVDCLKKKNFFFYNF